MRSYENTFVRGPSPTYSDEGASASAFNSNQAHLNLQNSFDEKCTGTYVGVVKQGRNTFAFWTVVVVLLILTVGNLMITLSIIGVLHLGRGIRGLELIPEENTIKFYGSTDLDRIYMKATPQIDSFTDVPVTIGADGGGGVNVRFQRTNGQVYNRLIMDESGIQFRAINSFEIKNPENGNTIFTTHRPHYNMAGSAESLFTKSVSVSRITSELDKPLQVEGDFHISIKGSEGISVDGANILLQAEQSLLINATQTVLDGPIFLDMDKLKKNIVSSEFGLRTGNVQYKLCVCMPQGQLFRIAIPRVHNGPKITCAHFSAAADPCAIN